MAGPDSVLELQRTVGNSAVVQLLGDGQEAPEERSPVLDVVGKGDGTPLDAETRTTMEAGLGADFADVRVHTDAAAARSAGSVQALAYTVGNDVVFQSGTYQPGTASGQRMLAHELTHVLQQRAGPVEGAPTAGGVAVSEPTDRFERAADDSADRFMSSRPMGPEHSDSGRAGLQRSLPVDDALGATVAGTGHGDSVQRQKMEGEEEEPVQATFVQRADLQELEDQTAS
jgi:hypothetical protein